jgi:hypothetical protein
MRKRISITWTARATESKQEMTIKRAQKKSTMMKRRRKKKKKNSNNLIWMTSSR